MEKDEPYRTYLKNIDVLFGHDNPPESAIGIWYDVRINRWLDEGGFEHADLRDFGFTTMQVSVIKAMMEIRKEQEYMVVMNNNHQVCEIYWESLEPVYVDVDGNPVLVCLRRV